MKLIEILNKNKIEYIENEEMKMYTTLHIGGKADLIVFPKNQKEIETILQYTKPVILGNGSNVLVSDEGIKGSVMILRKFRQARIVDNQLICEAGLSLKEACRIALDHNLSGMEFAFGIPGSVGGAIYMNAGAYGGEMQDIVSEVKIYKGGKILTLKKEELGFSYRHSNLMEEESCILSVAFQLKKGKSELIQMKMEELWQKRLEKQPLEHFSAGSTFKRGSDFYASALINECGLKGYRVNDASVSMKHSGFLINEGNASFQDFVQLMEEVKQIVYEKTEKILEPEVKILK